MDQTSFKYLLSLTVFLSAGSNAEILEKGNNNVLLSKQQIIHGQTFIFEKIRDKNGEIKEQIFNQKGVRVKSTPLQEKKIFSRNLENTLKTSKPTDLFDVLIAYKSEAVQIDSAAKPESGKIIFDKDDGHVKKVLINGKLTTSAELKNRFEDKNKKISLFRAIEEKENSNSRARLVKKYPKIFTKLSDDNIYPVISG